MTNENYETITRIQENEAPVLFLFHGTGADYHDLLPIAHLVDPRASIVSVNGNVFVRGARRYFNRTDQGVDLADLTLRSKELAHFLDELIEREQIEDRKKIAVGYSNGANIIIGMLQNHSKIFDGVGLLHGAPYLEINYQDVNGLDVYVSLGENDTMIDPHKTLQMVKQLDKLGSVVTVYSHQQGHRLINEELEAFKEWYEEQKEKE